jgi:archaemetzincin
MGDVNQLALSVVAANIQALFGMPVEIEAPWPDPAFAIIPGRGQYNAIPILSALGKGLQENQYRIGVLNRDLCLPFLTYVFGEARVHGHVAVVSLYRLSPKQAGRGGQAARSLERLAKIAVHEMAHALGLTHCDSPGCPMSFSPELEALDRLTLEFCFHCRSALRRHSLPLSGPGDLPG